MGIKLVIADDAPFILEGIRGLLKVTEISIVAEAVDGKAAVKLALNLKPDIILMDLIMPEKNGIEAAKEILAAWPKAKIIACSTEESSGLLLKAIEAGCCDYIAKPFTSELLIKKIRDNHYNQKREL